MEQTAVGELRSTASLAGCGGVTSTSVVMIQQPAQDWLVQTNPAFAGSGQTLLVSNTGPSQTAAIGSPPPGQVAGERAHRNASLRLNDEPPTAAILHAVFARDGTPTTPTGLLVLGGAGLLVVLTLLSAVGRRLAQREQLAMAAGTAVPAAFGPATAVSAPEPSVATDEEHHPAGAAEWVTASAAPVAPGATDPGGAGSVAASDPAPSPAAPPRVTPAPPVAEATPASAVERALSPNQGWLRTHRSQIALAVAAIAGSALRIGARPRRRL